MDLKLKRNRGIHVNGENQKVNSHTTWVTGERHLHVRITPQSLIVAPMRSYKGSGYFPVNADTILTPLNLNEKLHKNHKREGEVFTGDRKRNKIEE